MQTTKRHSLKGAASFFTALLSVLAIPQTATANTLTDTHIFRFGVYQQDIDVLAVSNRKPLPEVEFNFDDVLGLDEDATSIFLQYQWRIKDKWSLSAFYTSMEANGKTTTSRDFNWDGQEFEAGLRLDSEFGLDTFLVSVDYSFVKNDKLDLGVGFGLHAFDIETTLQLELNALDPLEGSDTIARVARTSGDLLAPLPNIRAYGSYMVTPKWALVGSIGWLSADYDDWSGDYLFLTLLTEYRLTDRFGVGVSYQISEVDFSNDNGRRKRSYDIDQYGPAIYLTYGF